MNFLIKLNYLYIIRIYLSILSFKCFNFLIYMHFPPQSLHNTFFNILQIFPNFFPLWSPTSSNTRFLFMITRLRPGFPLRLLFTLTNPESPPPSQAPPLRKISHPPPFCSRLPPCSQFSHFFNFFQIFF